MVAKITTGKDIYGALFYNHDKVNREQATVLATHIIREPEDGNFNISDTAGEFLQWMPNQFRTEKPVIHISLNPHEEDKLTDEQLSEIAEKYMQKMGYGEQPYIVFKHTDIERKHIHIVSVQVDSTGKKIKDSKRNERSVAVTEDLEREYGLHPAKGQKKVEHWQLIRIDPALGNLKKQMAAIIKPACKMYRFQTLGEFRALLSFYNIGVEEVQGTRNGKPYRGLLYTVLDEQRNKTGLPLKSSLFGKEFGINALEKQMFKSGEIIKKGNNREKIRNRVADAFRDASTEEALRAKLQKLNISLFLRRNGTGRIVGVTFIDHNERYVMNGSRLGKEYSANALNQRLEGAKNTRVNSQQVTDSTQKKKLTKLKQNPRI